MSNILYCDDDLERSQEVTKLLSKYGIMAVSTEDAEKLMKINPPALVLAHTTNEKTLILAKELDVPAIAIVDEKSDLEDLRQAGNYAQVVEIANLETSIEGILPSEKEFDITCPVIPDAYEDVALMTNYIPRPQQLPYPIPQNNYPSRAEIVVVASGKGGVGKTTVTACLALELQRRGVEVCAVDFDLNCPSLDTVLHVRNSKGLKDLLAAPENAGDALLDSCMAVHPSGLKVLLPENDMVITRGDAEKVLRNIIRQNEVVIIDVGKDITDHIRACVDYASKVLLVSTLTTSAIKNIKLWIQKMSPMDMTKLYFLINQSNRSPQFPVTSAQRVMGLNLVGVLPDEPRVARGEGGGNPLPGKGNFAKEISCLADVVWPWKTVVKNQNRMGLFVTLKEVFSR